MRLALIVCLGLACAAQDFSKIQVEKVAAGYTFTEGPAWSPDGFLVFSDIPASRILKLVPGQHTAVWRENTNGTNGNAFDKDGRLVSCESHTRRVIRTDRKGRTEVLAESWQGRKLNAPNDVAIRKDGHIWFTDPAFGNQEQGRELTFFGLYHITPKRSLELAQKFTTRPNGVTLSPDGRILYVADSDARLVRALDADHNGALSNERVLIRDIEGVPDGLRADERGNLYVAAGSILVYSPDGKPLATIPIPETASNVSFGDPDLKTLYVTARTSVYRVRLDVQGIAP